MPEIFIRLAQSESDFEAARVLCQAWVDWQLKTFPELREEILRVFEPVAYARTMANLHRIHARPKGAILLAFVDDRPIGCVMYIEMDAETAEVKRLFVDEAGRGLGLGKRLLTEMLHQMKSDNYKVVHLSSARFLIHARQLYEDLGFLEISAPATLPDELKSIVYFMERPL